VATVVDDDERTVSFGLGSVGPVPLRAPEAEALAATRFGDASAAGEIGALVTEAARPIDDHRGTADYRRHAVGVLAARSIRAAWS
jgi:CO/xanthine dehydrogenase FAD-binding subunit